jgi:hypothetical protein
VAERVGMTAGLDAACFGQSSAVEPCASPALTKIIMVVEAPKPMGASAMPIKIVNIKTIVIRQITGGLENSGGTASTAKIVSRLSCRETRAATALRHLVSTGRRR